MHSQMISVEAAQDILRDVRPQFGTETLAVDQALGRIVSCDMTAQLTVPPHNVSAMDGYAVRLADVQVAGANLNFIGEAPAGAPFQGHVKPGQAVRIFTGAFVPTGADHIVIQENVTVNADQVHVPDAYAQPQHIRQAGQDFKAGDMILQAGTPLRAGDIAVAAAANYGDLSVYRRPRVALLSCGNELRPAGTKDIGAGQIINSNTPALAALLRSWGADPLICDILPDDPDAIRQQITKLPDADILVPIGGASVGKYDYMRATFGGAGCDLKFEKIAVKPGKPTWFGMMGTQCVLGLPGNPASALVCAHLFLKPLLGLSTVMSQAVLTQDVSANAGRETYQRAYVNITEQGMWGLTPFPRQDSALMRPFQTANAFMRLPVHSGPWKAGDLVEYTAL